MLQPPGWPQLGGSKSALARARGNVILAGNLTVLEIFSHGVFKKYSG